MKLASLKSGGRDGTLVVVDRRLERAVRVPQIVATLQQALERWHEVEAPLAMVAQELEAGTCADAFAFDPALAASPLPRAYQFLDGSVYLHHMEKARKARGAAMPPNYKTEPLMYQGLSDAFCGPYDPLQLPDDNLSSTMRLRLPSSLTKCRWERPSNRRLATSGLSCCLMTIRCAH